jgi:hypothetical protein
MERNIENLETNGIRRNQRVNNYAPGGLGSDSINKNFGNYIQSACGL